MNEDIAALVVWILICATVAAICTTAVPILYAFFPWRTRRLGQLFMLQAVSFAVAMDATVIFTLWTPKSILVLFWINAIVFTAIAISTSLLAWWMWSLRRSAKKKEEGTKNVAEQPRL